MSERVYEAVHLFNHRGESVLTIDFLSAEVDRLNKELDAERGKTRALAQRLQSIANE